MKNNDTPSIPNTNNPQFIEVLLLENQSKIWLNWNPKKLLYKQTIIMKYIQIKSDHFRDIFSSLLWFHLLIVDICNIANNGKMKSKIKYINKGVKH